MGKKLKDTPYKRGGSNRCKNQKHKDGKEKKYDSRIAN